MRPFIFDSISASISDSKTMTSVNSVASIFPSLSSASRRLRSTKHRHRETPASATSSASDERPDHTQSLPEADFGSSLPVTAAAAAAAAIRVVRPYRDRIRTAAGTSRCSEETRRSRRQMCTVRVWCVRQHRYPARPYEDAPGHPGTRSLACSHWTVPTARCKRV